MTNSKLLTLVLILEGVILLGQWTGQPSVLPAARAELANPAEQRAQTVDEIRAVNARLDKLISILEGGKLKVQVTNLDEIKPAGEKKTDKPAK